MKTLPRPWPLWILLAGLLGGVIPGKALAQLTTSEEERLQVLSDPEVLKKKLEKDKTRGRSNSFDRKWLRSTSCPI